MRPILFLLFSGVILSQPRVGEILSITSTLEVRSLALLGDDILFATSGGLVTYNLKSQQNTTFTRDHGLLDTDINTIHVGPMGKVWLGSNSGIQVWDPIKESIINWFQLDIEFVSGFTNYKDMIYSSAKQNGKWGIMEFIYSNEKIYYRDFYYREDIDQIVNIVTFEEEIILHNNKGLISGNPHKEHPINWVNPYPNIIGKIQAIDANNKNLSIISSDKAYSIEIGGLPQVLVTDEINLSSINHVAVRANLDFIAISDSGIFEIGMGKIEKLYSIGDIKFSSVINYNSQIWLGLEVGFGYYTNGKFEHIVDNGPYDISPDVIS